MAFPSKEPEARVTAGRWFRADAASGHEAGTGGASRPGWHRSAQTKPRKATPTTRAICLGARPTGDAGRAPQCGLGPAGSGLGCTDNRDPLPRSVHLASCDKHRTPGDPRPQETPPGSRMHREECSPGDFPPEDPLPWALAGPALVPRVTRARRPPRPPGPTPPPHPPAASLGSR